MAAKLAKDLTLKGSSTAMPKLVYGTAWKKDRSADLVYSALKNGFRGIDTAGQPKHYNEKGVGEGVQRAIKDGLIKRGGLFVGSVTIYINKLSTDLSSASNKVLASRKPR
jgi:diketogulonate reductase-like aldo/keto reductase